MPNSPAQRLILASTSPYRRRLLERLQIPFECVDPDVDESPAKNEGGQQLASRLAGAKSIAGSQNRRDAFVIGSDQVAALGARLLGKPGNATNALQQLRDCSGAQVDFYTAVAIAKNGKILSNQTVLTQVRFRELTETQLRDYIERDEPYDCAGSFRWEGLGISLFESLHSDDPTALEGLPLIELTSMLSNIGIYTLNTTI